MPNKSFDLQEYSQFRQELTTIIQARYTILGLIIVSLGVITGYITTSSAAISVFSVPFKIQLLSPYLYLLFLLPAMLVTLLLTVHYRRLDAYLWARFESEGGLPFQRAYSRFRARSKFHPAYTEPLLWTYSMINVFALLISLLVNYDVVTEHQKYWLVPLVGFVLLILIGILFWFAIEKYAGRILTQSYRIQWANALNYVKRHPETETRGAVFLDRDGVINENKNTGVISLSLFKFIPGATKALSSLSRKGIRLIVITNQPYIGNHEMTEKDLEAIHKHMEDEIWKSGGYIDAIYTCPHAESYGCSCRKPKTQLFERAAEELKIDLKKSWVVGDQMSDMEASNAIGARAVLVLTGEGKKTQIEAANYSKDLQPYRIARDVKEAADIILKEGI